ncbi:hypothetical protein PIB30_055973 [Stylosanthes scabra]|uniref:Uncharacterized protein n=1 Tax=Stylosanthes scabra TaxID=79078 RepID=A0ABU6TJ19_9FABA|nr:hypothetical protein [Stylosanthes scabra]
MDPGHWRFFLMYQLKEETQEAIQEIEGCDQSYKELFQNDSLAQVLEKEHPVRVRGVGAGPCPTQIINHGTQQTSYAFHVDMEEYKKMIVELKAEAAEEKRKSQAMKTLVRYLIQHQGYNLPPTLLHR